MVTQDLINFINQSLAKGTKKEDIKATLLKSNWSEADINQAFDSIKTGIPTPPDQVAQPTSPDHNTKTIIVVVMLLFFYPIGIVLMWLWMKDWPKWVKIVLTLMFALPIIAVFGIIASIILVATNPAKNVPIPNITPTTYIYASPTEYLLPTSAPDQIEIPVSSPSGLEE